MTRYDTINKVGEIKLSDVQIMGRVSYNFKRLSINDYSVLNDNYQSFAIFLCQSILDKTERYIVREKLQSKGIHYFNVAGSVALSVGCYLGAGLVKGADDVLMVIDDLSHKESGKVDGRYA